MSLTVFRGWWALGFTGEPRQVWLATDASGPVGCYLLELPDQENTSLGLCVPLVAPAARRRGLGTALLRHCCRQAERAGRDRLIGGTAEGSAGQAFARSVGAADGLTDERRVLTADASLAARMARLRASATPAAAGYEVLRWSGATPEEHLAQVAAVNDAMGDAPHEAGLEAQRWDGARIRASEERSVAQGLRLYSVAARQVTTGQLAALTQVMIDSAAPDWGFQQITAVTRPHRGHRLGLLIKSDLHQWLARAEPRVRQFLTHNSETNQHMVAINEQLGYRVTARIRSWELSVPGYLARA
jgi:GNAT superfamily N-acetyltransferase